MEELLSNLYSSSSTAVWSVIILGLMTAISPCPLATNITAMGFISKDLKNRKKVLYNGIIYTAGRALSYTLLAFILYFGADQIKISSVFQQYGEKFLGPILIIIGIFMLGIININFFGFDKLKSRFQNKEKRNYWDVLLIGVLFALTFCPYSGVLYFGMVIPLTLQSSWGLLLPIVFAITTAIPALIFAWLLAFAVSEVGKLYKHIKSFEFWFRRIVAFIFIAIGIYYTVLLWF